MKILRNLALAAAALFSVAGPVAAADMVFSTGLTFVPTGPALFQGRDLNVIVDRVNNLSDGSFPVTGNFSASGSITAGTSLAVGTTAAITGALTPTGGVAAAGGFSVSPRLVFTGGEPAIATTSGTDATPVATTVYIAEMFVPANMTVTGMACFNGSVASGNYKVGLADSTGAVAATSASTAMSGTDAYQRVAFTAPVALKGPATYYGLQFIDNTTARFNTHTVGNFGASTQTSQVYATGFTTITPPTTFTTAVGPICGLY